MADFVPVIGFVLQAEGGKVNDPRDPGGATNMGITLSGWQQRRPGATLGDLWAMTRDQAVEYYREYYWLPMGGPALPAGLDLEVFDFGVNAGADKSIRALQTVLGAKVDGVLGPVTLGMSHGTVGEIRAKVTALANAHEAYYHGLGTFGTFGRGWTARVNAGLAMALHLAGGDLAPGNAAAHQAVPLARFAPALPKPTHSASV